MVTVSAAPVSGQVAAAGVTRQSDHGRKSMAVQQLLLLLMMMEIEVSGISCCRCCSSQGVLLHMLLDERRSLQRLVIIVL